MTAVRLIGLAVMLVIAACAPRLQPAGPAATEPRLEAHAFVTGDGLELPVRRWLPEGPPKAVILALHGFNDYSNAFDGPARLWSTRGIATYAYDQRGFGAAPHPGLWPGTWLLVSDLEAMSALVRRRHPGVPFYLLGESMGGAVVMTAMAGERPPAVDGVILVAPAVWGRETMDIFKRAALWLAARTVPWLKLTGRGLGLTPSDNVEMLKRLSLDPLVIKETRVDAIYGVVDLMDAALEAAPGLAGRLLVLYGENDEIVPRRPIRAMLDRLPPAPPAVRRVAVYPEGYHMLTRDLQAEVVIEDIAQWIAEPEAALPSGADGRGLQALSEAGRRP